MSEILFLVGPTAVGKSALAVEIAGQLGAEILNVDAFQIYRGMDILTAKPDAAARTQVPHHLLGLVPLAEPMSAAKFREMALRVVSDVQARGKRAMFVGGSGLYVKAFTYGFDAPAPDPQLREQLRRLSLTELTEQLNKLDPIAASRIDFRNSRRVLRAVEIATARRGVPGEDAPHPATAARCNGEKSGGQQQSQSSRGVLLVRHRDDLYRRINSRVEAMFRAGVVDEARNLRDVGPTATQALGLCEIRQLIAGEISQDDCVRSIQQATRRYAKRQLTWFRRQTSFVELNLTTLSHREALRAIRDHFAPA